MSAKQQAPAPPTAGGQPPARGNNLADEAPPSLDALAAALASAKHFAAGEPSAARPAPAKAPGELVAAFGAAKAGPDDEEAAFAALVRDIRENPELVFKSDLTAEQVLELQKRLNPYAFAPDAAAAAGPEPVVRSVAASYTNLREDYLRRFTMTSLVGFVFQMHEEWTVPPEVRRWTPAARRKKAAAADEASAPFDPTKLVGKLETALGVALEALRARQELDAALLRAKEELAVDDKSLAAAAAKAAAGAAAAKAAGLLYAATNTACRVGLEAEKRLDAAVADAAQYPEVRAILDRSNVRPGAGAEIEVPAELAKGIIGNFLKHWLLFDPNIHVRAARDGRADAARVELQTALGPAAADADDPARLPIELLLAAAPRPRPEDADHVGVLRASRGNLNAACRALRDRELAAALRHALQDEPHADLFRRYLYPVPPPGPGDELGRAAARKALELVPPQDTFHRWGYYTEVNYEELRSATEALYNDKPDLDWALGLWEVFEGSPAKVAERFDAYCERYQDEVPSSIKRLDLGGWSLLGDFKKGRENLRFYNKNTEILKRIIDRHTEDKKLGADLMRKRVRDLKSKNIAAEGPDAPGLTQYKKTATAVPSLGAERVISAVEMRRLEKARGDPRAAKELEVLEAFEARILELARIAAARPLTVEEKYALEGAKRGIERAVEALSVPDDAVQVDTWTHDTASGAFEKGSFYTEAEKPEHVERGRQEAAQRSSGSLHPAVRRTEARELGRDAPPAGQPPSTAEQLEALAPFALQYMKLQEDRSAAQRHQEAAAAAAAASASAPAPASAPPAAAAEPAMVQLPGSGVLVPVPAGAVAVVVEPLPAS